MRIICSDATSCTDNQPDRAQNSRTCRCPHVIVHERSERQRHSCAVALSTTARDAVSLWRDLMTL